MRRLLVIMCSLTALFSSFLDNVTTILLFVPVTIELCRLLNINPVPFLVSEVMFSNIGGTATLIGDPPNILIGSALPEVASFVDFLANAAPGILLACIPSMYLLLYIYRKDVPAGRRDIDIRYLKGKYIVTDEVQLGRIGIILAFVLLGFFMEPLHGLHSVWIACAGGVGVIFVSGHHHIQRLLMHIEWETLLFFAGLFVIVECVRELGLIAAIGSALSAGINGIDDPSDRLTGGVVMILWASAFASAVLDNIPFTATMIQVIVQVAEQSDIALPPLVWALSFGACLGGNATLVGASANLVMAGLANKEKIPINFKMFTAVGFPVMIVTCFVTTIYMLIRYCT
jgi:Na+/H+ antiporter NhaD/arsenite permease-like protein